MLAPGNYVQWKYRIKRYIDTKPNNELIHYCFQNPPYKYKLTKKTVPVAEAEAIQIILTGIDNDIYSAVDACPNACEMCECPVLTSTTTRMAKDWALCYQVKSQKTVSYHKLYDILKQHQNEVNEIRAKSLARIANPLALVAHPTQNNQYSSNRSQQPTKNRGKAIVNSFAPIYDQEPVTKIYKPTNNNLRTSSNSSRANQDNSPRINRGTGYDNQRVVNVARARDNVEEAGVQLNAEQADWKDDTHDESDDQELEAHYMYMEQIQEVTPDPVDNSGPIFDVEPLHKVQNNNNNYNVFAIENEHPEQPESVNDIYLEEQGDQSKSQLIH
ncbi:hypothetical protein Tco_1156649 [Tanacetum coccineum]